MALDARERGMIRHADCAAPREVRGMYEVRAEFQSCTGAKVGDLHVFADSDGLESLAQMILRAVQEHGPDHGAVYLKFEVAIPQF